MATIVGPPKVDPNIQRFALSLVTAAKTVVLYPRASSILQTAVVGTSAILNEVFYNADDLLLQVGKTNLWCKGVPLLSDTRANRDFVYELYRRKLAVIRFDENTKVDDIIGVLSILKETPEDLEGMGGAEAYLVDLGVTAITVREPTLAVFGEMFSQEEGGPVPREVIDDILISAVAGDPGSRQAIVLSLVKPQVLAQYFLDVAEDCGENVTQELGSRFAQIAQVAQSIDAEDADLLIGSLWDATAELDTDVRAELLVKEVLATAKSDTALSAVVRYAESSMLGRILAEGMEHGDISKEGFTRAARAIESVTGIDGSSIREMLEREMKAAGVSEEYASDLMELLSPDRSIFDQEALGIEGGAPTASIVALLDLAPMPFAAFKESEDPEVAAIVEESKRGVTDSDVVTALVMLAGLERSSDALEAIMKALEDSLSVLLDLGEIEVVAEAATGLRAHADDLTGSPEQREQLNDALGSSLIKPVLEHLAEESEMSIRKALVELLSRISTEQIDVLGAYIQDSRWYFVRNVVNIMGATRSASALPYLARALQHPEPRVRREAIRALSSIPIPGANDGLIRALSDNNLENVQLAIRLLGVSRSREAVPALGVVVEGEGMGNRDLAVRMEAIDALGKIGDPAAARILAPIASKWSFLGVKKTRQLSEAARAAMDRIAPGGTT
ncbi:MAG: HEAT repeat domain-containing protein [Coriobacteriia bacterium]|nr:HEAT repeat domain-containing protein [Coriobacteriia bacterium]